MQMENNLISIAKILISLKPSREFILPKDIKEKYPDGSVGIKIKDQNWIVVNNTKNEDENKNQRNIVLNYEKLKYNPNFFFSTTGKEPIEPITEDNNKEILINEAYEDVSFLQKFHECNLQFDESVAKEQLSKIIKLDIDPNIKTFSVENINKKEPEYDNIYRASCIFFDTAGNAQIKTLNIRIYKTIVDSDPISYVIDENYTSAAMDSMEEENEIVDSVYENNVYKDVNDEEIQSIYDSIRTAILEFINSNQDRYSNISKITIKAVFNQKFNKNPIRVSIEGGDKKIISSELLTYYSMVSKDNTFSCPNCGKTNLNTNDDNSNFFLELHVDEDLSENKNDYGKDLYAIGCNNCMERCDYCGNWHFKFEFKSNLRKYHYSTDRNFLIHLSNLKDNNQQAKNFCSCRKYKRWVPDEMSSELEFDYKLRNAVDKFLKKNCSLVFVSIETGEKIATHNDFLCYLYKTLVDKKKNLLIKNQVDISLNKKEDIINTIVKFFRFINKQSIFDTSIETVRDIKEIFAVVEDCITKDYKNELANALSIDSDTIKITSKEYLKECSSCKAEYYMNEFYDSYNDKNETLYDERGKCKGCLEAEENKYHQWTRMADNVTFFKPKVTKNGKEVLRIFDSPKGEIEYDTWLKNSLIKISGLNEEGKKHEK